MVFFFLVVVVVFFEENDDDDDKHRLAIGSSATRLSVLFRANSASENTQTTAPSTSNDGARKFIFFVSSKSRCGKKTHPARNVSRTRTRASRSASDEKNNEDDDDTIAVVLLLLLLV